MTKVITPKKKENRGGARPNSGPKPHELSPEFKESLIKSLDKKAKEEGQTFTDLLVELAYDRRQSSAARAQFIKIIAQTFTVKQSHQTIDKRELHAVVMLPPVMQSPQRLVEGAGPVIDAATGEVVNE